MEEHAAHPQFPVLEATLRMFALALGVFYLTPFQDNIISAPPKDSVPIYVALGILYSTSGLAMIANQFATQTSAEVRDAVGREAHPPYFC